MNKKKTLLISFAVVLIIVIIIIVSSEKGEEIFSFVSGGSGPSQTEREVIPPERYVFEKDGDTVSFGDEITCRYGILIDVGSGRVIGEKDGYKKIYPASMTKVLTVLVAYEKCDDLDDTFEITTEITDKMYTINATVAGFSCGEKVTVKDLIYGAVLPSGGDATMALAIYTAGSEEKFADLMNEKCAEIGALNTHFVTSSGLHENNHYTTCYDMALIMNEAMKYEDLREVFIADEYVTSKTPEHPEGIKLSNTLYERIEGSEEFDEKIEIIAGKPGYTDEAHNTLVTVAQVKGKDNYYIFVCADSFDKWTCVYDTLHVYRKYLGVEFDGEYVPKYLR